MRAVYRVIILMIFVLLISVFSTEASRITAVDTHHEVVSRSNKSILIDSWKEKNYLDNYNDLRSTSNIKIYVYDTMSKGKINIEFVPFETTKAPPATNFLAKACLDEDCNITLDTTIEEKDFSDEYKKYIINITLPGLQEDTYIYLIISYIIPNFIEKKEYYYIGKFTTYCNVFNICPPEYNIRITYFIPYQDTIIEKIIPESIISNIYSFWQELEFTDNYKEIWFSRPSETSFWAPFFWALFGALVGSFLEQVIPKHKIRKFLSRNYKKTFMKDVVKILDFIFENQVIGENTKNKRTPTSLKKKFGDSAYTKFSDLCFDNKKYIKAYTIKESGEDYFRLSSEGIDFLFDMRRLNYTQQEQRAVIILTAILAITAAVELMFKLYPNYGTIFTLLYIVVLLFIFCIIIRR